MDGESGPIFNKNLEKFDLLFKNAGKNPSSNRDSLNKLLLKCEKTMTDNERVQLTERVKRFIYLIYGSGGDDAKYCAPKLNLRSDNQDIKYRELFHRMVSFVKCQPYIESIFNDNPDLLKHVLGSDVADNFKFDEKFISDLQSLIAYRQTWMKLTEEIKSINNNSFFDVLSNSIDFVCESSGTTFAAGSGPLSTPYQL